MQSSHLTYSLICVLSLVTKFLEDSNSQVHVQIGLFILGLLLHVLCKRFRISVDVHINIVVFILFVAQQLPECKLLPCIIYICIFLFHCTYTPCQGCTHPNTCSRYNWSSPHCELFIVDTNHSIMRYIQASLETAVYWVRTPWW